MSAAKKRIREQFREEVFARDRNRCVFCGLTDNLDAHHITDRTKIPNGGYVKENGITLCPEHHELAEQFHISDGKEYAVGLHPDDLYKKIGSSHVRAIAVARKMSRPI